ncbi:MAG: glycosyl transferase family 2 [Proteobacteria bacterium]|nr:glycosyl transferase family 2 [Pseudomonadota bacterium]
MQKPVIEIIAVAYQRFGELKVFVQSILNQTADNWVLRVIHDGPDPEFRRLMQGYAAEMPERVFFEETATRYNDYGHSLRERGLREAKGDYVLLTNADNYYVPRFVQYLVDAIEHTKADLVAWDMIHSHDNPGGRGTPAYSYFKTEFERLGIDIGAAVVRRELAQAAGFPDKSHDGDASYFVAVGRLKGEHTALCRINRVLLVHN